jgi:micrococcal nuclease
MRFWQFLWLSLLLSAALNTLASDAKYKVSYVYDGDTVKLQSLQSGQEIKLRITDIDAPERNQSYGKQSRRALIKLCTGNDIQIDAKLTGTDQYHRHLGKLYCNNTNASLYLLQQGLAWHNAKYSTDSMMRSAAAKARAQKVGLWKQHNPMPPWVWRRKNLPASFN